MRRTVLMIDLPVGLPTTYSVSKLFIDQLVLLILEQFNHSAILHNNEYFHFNEYH